MDGNNQEVQSTVFPHYPIKLVIIILISMLFGIVFCVLLAQKGFFSSPITTNSIIPSATPTNVPTSTYQGGLNITPTVSCPPVTKNADDCNKPGFYCLRSIPPEGCPQGFIISCPQANTNLCSTDDDCIKEYDCENLTGFCCSKGRCVNGSCFEYKSYPGRCK